MADDLSDFPIMSDPEFEIPDSFEDWSSAGINLDDSFSWDSIWDAITSPTARTLLNLGSGLYGLYESGQQRNMARDAIRASDPFGPYRQQYAQQLMALMADPSSITKDPGYKFQFDQGAEAVRRAMASKGFIQSGNEDIALTEYGQSFAQKAYNDKITQLAGLAGAGISPNPGPGLNAYNQGLETASAALASLGYGITRGGSSAGTPGASRPNSAGGEAASLGSNLKTAGTLLSAGNQLAGLAGYGSSTVGTLGSGLGAAGGVVSGVQKGGVAGYTGAVTSGAKLAEMSGYGNSATSAISKAAPYAGAALGFYNAHKTFNNPHITNKSGAMAGAAAGAALGPVGMVIGAALGAIVGASNKNDPEEFTRSSYYNFITQNQLSDTSASVDPRTFYQSFAGEFRGKRSLYPARASGQYGRFDEDRFIVDMANRINSAYSSGQITKGDNASSVFDKVINPWITSDLGGWRTDSRYPTMQNEHQSLTKDLIGRFISGQPVDWGIISGGVANAEFPVPKYLGLGG